MALDDLNLEFEDEEEAKRKKNDAVHVDVDLEFHNPVGDKSRVQGAQAQAAPAAKVVPVKPAVGGPSVARTVAPASQPQSNVKNINDARPQQLGAIKRPTSVGASAAAAQPSAQPRVAGSSALQAEEHDQFESQELAEARAELKRVEFDSAVKVSVAEFKTELLSELNGDMKLMEHQINQLLARVSAKHADLNPEVLAIKKILAGFTSKKRK